MTELYSYVCSGGAWCMLVLLLSLLWLARRPMGRPSLPHPTPLLGVLWLVILGVGSFLIGFHFFGADP